MADPTSRLGLARPDDGDTSWGDGYRASMTTLDQHPGVRVVTSTTRPEDPWDGQLVFETDNDEG